MHKLDPGTDLRAAIDSAAQNYYTPGCVPTVTDAQYDWMLHLLRKIDPNDPRLTRVGTPSMPESPQKKRAHSIPMGSLDNTDDGIAGFAAWCDKTCALLGVHSFAINASLKMDGNSVALSYVDGVLTEAISRGNGEVGESLIENAVHWQGVPVCLPLPFTGTVRGEAILSKRAFEQLKKQDPSITNPRNVGSGIIGRADGLHSELINFVAFDIAGPNTLFLSLSEKHMALQHELGFNAVWFSTIQGTRDEVVSWFKAYFEEIEDIRSSLPFEIDGVVAMVDGIGHQHALTKDRKDQMRPKYGRAVKFVTAKAQTMVTGVTISLGHTGAIVPTAVLAPVLVGGVTVTNALLSNWNQASEYPSAAHVAIGDTVEIARQGDVIPKIVRVLERPDTRQPIAEPEVCPVCGSPTTRMLRGKEGVVTYCSNAECGGAAISKIMHYIGDSRKGVGILGVGDGVLEALTDSGLVGTPADLYRLRAEQLVDLQYGISKSGTPIRMGDSRAASLLAEIETAKQLSLPKFLGALGIPLLGRRRVETVAKEQGLTTLEDWLDGAKLASIPGEVTRKTIIEGLRKARPVIDDLLAVGVVVSPVMLTDPAATGEAGGTGADPIVGRTFCWTGCRDYLAEVKARGGIEKSGVSKGLDYLVQKDASVSSSKSRKAESYGTKIISVACLREALDGVRELP